MYVRKKCCRGPRGYKGKTGPTGAVGPTGPTKNTLLQETNFYVSTTGNDSNDGLTPATSFLTLNKAFQEANNVFKAVINLGAGTFNLGSLGSAGDSNYLLTNKNAIINGEAGSIISYNSGFLQLASPNSSVIINDIEFQIPAGASILHGLSSAVITFNNCNFNGTSNTFFENIRNGETQYNNCSFNDCVLRNTQFALSQYKFCTFVDSRFTSASAEVFIDRCDFSGTVFGNSHTLINSTCTLSRVTSIGDTRWFFVGSSAVLDRVDFNSGATNCIDVVENSNIVISNNSSTLTSNSSSIVNISGNSTLFISGTLILNSLNVAMGQMISMESGATLNCTGNANTIQVQGAAQRFVTTELSSIDFKNTTIDLSSITFTQQAFYLRDNFSSLRVDNINLTVNANIAIECQSGQVILTDSTINLTATTTGIIIKDNSELLTEQSIGISNITIDAPTGIFVETNSKFTDANGNISFGGTNVTPYSFDNLAYICTTTDKQIYGLTDPVLPQQVATKAYVDNKNTGKFSIIDESSTSAIPGNKNFLLDHTETSLYHGSLVLDNLTQGDAYHLVIAGDFSSVNGDTLTITLEADGNFPSTPNPNPAGGNILAQMVVPLTGSSNESFEIEADIIVRKEGSPGVAESICNMDFSYSDTGSTSWRGDRNITLNNTDFRTTDSKYLFAYYQFNTTNPNNNMKARTGYMTKLY